MCRRFPFSGRGKEASFSPKKCKGWEIKVPNHGTESGFMVNLAICFCQINGVLTLWLLENGSGQTIPFKQAKGIQLGSTRQNNVLLSMKILFGWRWDPYNGILECPYNIITGYHNPIWYMTLNHPPLKRFFFTARFNRWRVQKNMWNHWMLLLHWKGFHHPCSTNGKLVVWVSGLDSWKGLLLWDTSRIPNHQFSIVWHFGFG